MWGTCILVLVSLADPDVPIIDSCNLGAPRSILEQHTSRVKVHRTVKSRMDAAPPEGKKERYSPRAHLDVEPTWID